MFAARTLRCTTNPPNVTRGVPLRIPPFQRYIRLNSSSSTSTIKEHGTQELETNGAGPSAQEAKKPASQGIGRLKAALGEENVIKARGLGYDIRRLNYDLNRIYGRQRSIHRTLRGPYRVREQAADDTTTHPVKVTNNHVTVRDRMIPNIWLRDNCQCGSCMHDATKQRLLDTFSIPQDIAIQGHSWEGVDPDRILAVEWSDGHKSSYPYSLLSKTAKSFESRAVTHQGLAHVALWDSSIASSPPKLPYHLVNNKGKGDTGRLLRNLRKYGFCYVDETPFDDPNDTKKLLEKIAFIRETHYGGFYDFTSDLASKDTAYTNIALEAHTDTTYFSDPVGLQAFHLLSHTDGSGGASLLVDGFKAAHELSQVDRKAYEVLSTVNIHAHASGNEGISIQPYKGFPVLEHDPSTGDLLRVRWNSSDRASIELRIEEVGTWYDAARKFDALLKKKENEYWEQLVPGRVLIFDNWRVLHGRSAFTGKRRICGAYVNRDDWISKFKMAEFGRDQVLEGLAVN